jgi:hypothetical protein
MKLKIMLFLFTFLYYIMALVALVGVSLALGLVDTKLRDINWALAVEAGLLVGFRWREAS